MKSKISCFNKTLFLKNIFRFWPIWALYMAILFFILPFSLLQGYAGSRIYELTGSAQVRAVGDVLSNALNINLALTAVFSIGIAILVFGYLFQAKNTNMIHALPVTRKELFITGYLDGILFLIVPQIIMFLVTMFICICNNITYIETLFFWLVSSVVFSLLFYSAAVFSCMLTGNEFSALFYYVLGNFIYLIAKYLILFAVSKLCYGMYYLINSFQYLISSKDGFFTPAFYLATNVNINLDYVDNIPYIVSEGGVILALYLIPSVLLILFAHILYQKRQLECAGDVAAFRWMRPIFRWGISFLCGIGFSLVLSELFFNKNHFDTLTCIFVGSIIFGLIAYCLSEMILQKSFRIFTKRRCTEGIICIACIFFLLLGIKADVFHVENRVPDASNVSLAVVENDNLATVLDSPEEISALTDAHHCILANKRDNIVYDETQVSAITDPWAYDAYRSNYCTITYFLNNGKSFQRMYTLPADADHIRDTDSPIARIAALQSNPKDYLEYSICKEYDTLRMDYGYLDHPVPDDTGTISLDTINFSEAQTQIIYEALQKDIFAGNYPIGVETNVLSPAEKYYPSLFLSTAMEEPVHSVFDILPENIYYQFDRHINPEYINGSTLYHVDCVFELYPSCTYTIQALIDTGIIQSEDDLMTWEDYDTYSQG